MSGLTDAEWKQFYLFSNQTQLLEQDLSDVIGENFLFSEYGRTDDCQAWFMTGGIRNSALLFRQEILDMVHQRFSWPATVQLQFWLAQDEPYQYLYLRLSPLPPPT